MSNVVRFKKPRQQKAARPSRLQAIPPAVLGWTVLIALAVLITLFKV